MAEARFESSHQSSHDCSDWLEQPEAEFLGELPEAERSPDLQETPARGTFINVHTGEVRPFLANGPDTDDWAILSPDPTLSIDRAKELVAEGGYGDLLPEQVHFE